MSYKMLRKQYGFTQSDVSKMTGVNQALVSLFENNKFFDERLDRFYAELDSRKYQRIVLGAILAIGILVLIYTVAF